MCPCWSSGWPHSGQGGRPDATTSRGPLDERAGGRGRHPDAEHVRAVLVVVLGRLERGQDRGRERRVELRAALVIVVVVVVLVGLGSSSSSSSSASISISIGSARASTRTRSASASQPSVSVVARNASTSGSSSGPVSARRLLGGGLGDAALLELVEELVEPLGEDLDLDLLEDDADDLARLAGLEEERPLAGFADRAGNEAVGWVEVEHSSGHGNKSTPLSLPGRQGSVGQPTRTVIVWWPRAPSGAGGVTRRRLDLAVAVGRPDLDRWSPGPAAAASQAYVHWTQVASEIGVASCAVPPLPVDRDLDLRDAAIRRPRDAGDRDAAGRHGSAVPWHVDPGLGQDRALPWPSRAAPSSRRTLPRS